MVLSCLFAGCFAIISAPIYLSKKVTCPIFIIHGKKDVLIPFKHSEMLQRLVPQNCHLFPIDAGGHNNLPEFAEYHDILYDILNDEALHARLLAEQSQSPAA